MHKTWSAAFDAMIGPSFGEPPGYIAIPGQGEFRHRFGGESWHVKDSKTPQVTARLLLTLDLNDPALTSLRPDALNELPLCSVVEHDINPCDQLFHIEPAGRTVTCIQRDSEVPSRGRLARHLRLEEKPLTLVPMTEEDIPVSEEAYWRASDHFLGGSRFIRVLGPPLWLYAAESITCLCGRRMQYVAALGYESRPPYSQLREDGPVFFGEMAFYWYLCDRCANVAVTAQSS
jgi:hypothetical protein